MAYAPLQRAISRTKANQEQEYQQILREAEAYRQALSRAAMGEASQELSTGLGGIQGFLSTRGPLSDSGAAPALASRLASGLYGAASNRVGQGYAQYLAQALGARRMFRYQSALLKAQQKAQQTGFGGIVGGLAGAFLPGVGGLFGGKKPVFGNDFGGGYNWGGDPGYRNT